MKNLLKPDYYFKSLYDIDINWLKELNIKNLILDIDNTLVSWGTKQIDERGQMFINNLLKEGFRVCLLSNSSSKRVKNFINNELILYYTGFGIKPMKIKFLGALKLFDNKIDETCVIGDQIFTDILGGKRVGIKTILVDPIDSKEFLQLSF
ncbi:YqeG family HAD IIIA-type phosphatase [Caloramator sp. mosi_1]|nr:YqeG family HAD IIIA-type phosphatase [Caloramator sp. mosi_1]WDC83771.1 YqeG family HAD IIIA-type phosphatase [Caloramator sp. mosi_1]